jgi:hypothetical protein
MKLGHEGSALALFFFLAGLVVVAIVKLML